MLPDTRPSPASPASDAGVIHDIGYRHYDGPRLGRAYVRRSLFLESARGGFGLGRSARSKIVPLGLLVVMSLPALVSVAITAIVGLDSLPIGFESYVLSLQVIVGVYVAAQAPASVSRDLRFGVLPLHFSRPMERRDYVSAKFAAMVADVAVLLAVPLTILLAGTFLVRLPVGENLLDYAQALGGALLLAVLLSGIGLVIASVTPRRGLGVAAIVTVLLVLSGVQAAVSSILEVEGLRTAAGWAGLLSPVTLVEGVAATLLRFESDVPIGPPGAVGGAGFVLAYLLVVAACVLALLRRYRKVSGT